MKKLYVVLLVAVCATALTTTGKAAHGDRSKALATPVAEVDRLVQANWTRHGVRPSTKVNDQVFLRRVYLDLTGTIPTGRQALAFLESRRSNKRQVLIDYLLESEGYVSHSFNYWADVLRIKSQIGNIEFHGYVGWVKDSIRENKPYDQFVFELLSANGRVSQNGATGYYLRDQGMPLDNTANTVAIFLGTQIGCAQCHDHPFEAWTQHEFYQMAAFTHALTTRGGGGKQMRAKRKQVDEVTAKRNLTPQQRQAVRRLFQTNQWLVKDAPFRKLRLPKDYQYDDAKPGTLVSPKTIFKDDIKLQPGKSPREAYARWLASAANDRFARVIANRLWKRFMGVGLIEPVDDIDGAEASNPELLDYLTRQMIAMKFDLKQFTRLIVNSDVYQRRAVYRDVEEETYHFPGPTLRRMTAEQFWDSLATLAMDDPLERKYDDLNPSRYTVFDLGEATPGEIVSAGLKAAQRRKEVARKLREQARKRNSERPQMFRASELRQPAPDSHLLREFGQSDRNLIEGSNTDPSLTQILALLNGRHHYQIVREGSILSEHLERVKKNPQVRARVIYLSTLGREPLKSEMRLAMQLFREEKAAKPGDRALIWILLNTPEFLFVQ